MLRGARRLVGRRGLRRASAACGIRRLDHRAQGCAFRAVLPCLHPGLGAIPEGCRDSRHCGRQVQSAGHIERCRDPWRWRRRINGCGPRLGRRLALLPGVVAARRWNAGQEHGGHAARRAGDSALVAKRPRHLAGPAAACAPLRRGARRRCLGSVAGHRGDAGLLRPFAGGAPAHRLPLSLVLHRPAGLAGGIAGDLPALGNSCWGFGSLGGLARRRDLGRDALAVARAHRSRTAGGGGVLRGDAVADARLCRSHLHALFLCGGSVSVSGRHRRTGGGRRRGCPRGQSAADGLAQGRGRRRGGCAAGARRADLAASEHLQRQPDIVPPCDRAQPGGRRRPPEPGASADRRKPNGGSRGGGAHRRAATARLL